MGPDPALPRAPIRARNAEFSVVAAGEAKPTEGVRGVCARDGCDRPLSGTQRRFCSIRCSTARRTEQGCCLICGKVAFSRYALICSMACRSELIRRRGGRHVWSPEFVAKVQSLWGEGLSCSKIGARLGVTKCVIIGLARRLALPARENPIKPAAKAKAPPRPRARRAAPAKAPRSMHWKSDPARRTPPVPIPAVGKRIEAAARSAATPIKVDGIPGTGCQFPVSERPWIVCDAPRVPNRAGSTQLGPYCAACSRRCYAKLAA
jgi:hypothetical protein